MLLLRKIFFYLFLVLYIILCPLTILYALGYIFTPGSERGLVKTGLIYLSTTPPGASVYIGRSRYTQKTPATLRDLIAGDYPVKLSLRGHLPWTKTLPVEAEKATILEKILLIPNPLQREELMAGSFEELLPVPETRFFLISKGPAVGDLWVYDAKEEKARPFVSKESPFYDLKIVSHFTVPGSPALLLHVHHPKEEKFLWADLREKEIRPEDVTALFPERPFWVSWDPHEKNILFAFQKGTLNRLDVASRAVYPKFAEAIRGYGASHKSVYLLRNSGVLEKVDEEGRHPEPIAGSAYLEKLLTSPDWESVFFGKKEFFRIQALSEETLLLWGERGELFSNRFPYECVKSGLVGFEWDPPLKRLLLWQKGQVGILDFAKSAAPFWIFKKGEAIEQAFWVYEGSHILFRDKEQVFLLELETYGKPLLYPLLSVKKKSSVFYSEESGKLYYLDETTGNLSAVEILPKKKESELQEL